MAWRGCRRSDDLGDEVVRNGMPGEVIGSTPTGTRTRVIRTKRSSIASN